MWHLNFILPLAVDVAALVAVTLFLSKLIIDAIVDGTAKKGGENIGQDIIGSVSVGDGSSKTMPSLCVVEQKPVQCAPELDP